MIINSTERAAEGQTKVRCGSYGMPSNGVPVRVCALRGKVLCSRRSRVRASECRPCSILVERPLLLLHLLLHPRCKVRARPRARLLLALCGKRLRESASLCASVSCGMARHRLITMTTCRVLCPSTITLAFETDLRNLGCRLNRQST